MSKVDDILAAVDLMSILPKDSNLKSVGRDRWRGACPIESHRSLSTFAVSRHEAGHLIFACFACGKRGSVIDLFAAMNRIAVAESIGKLASKDLPQLSPDAMMQRSYDAYQRTLPQYCYLFCDNPGCRAMLKIDSLLDFAILCKCGSWLWDICSDGSAKCIEHRTIHA